MKAARLAKNNYQTNGREVESTEKIARPAIACSLPFSKGSLMRFWNKFLELFFSKLIFIFVFVTITIIPATKASIPVAALETATTVWSWTWLVWHPCWWEANIPVKNMTHLTRIPVYTNEDRYKIPSTHFSRLAAALFLTSCILSLLFKRATIFSAFFLTLMPESFPLGSTYSNPVSDFTSPNKTRTRNVRNSSSYWRKCITSLSGLDKTTRTEIWKVCSTMSSTARSDPLAMRYSMTVSAWPIDIRRECMECTPSLVYYQKSPFILHELEYWLI